MRELHSPCLPDTAIPGLRNVDHVAFTVPDLEEAIAFFGRVIGCELVYRAAPLFDREGDWMTRHMGVPSRSELHLAMLRCGPTMNLALLEWSGAGPTGSWASGSGGCGQHLAFYVTEMAPAIEHLAATPGVRVLGQPTMATGPLDAGAWFAFFLTPWGMRLQLVSRPVELPYEAVTPHRLFGPAQSWYAP